MWENGRMSKSPYRRHFLWFPAVAVWASLLLATSVAFAAEEDRLADRVHEYLQVWRLDAGVPELPRRGDLDAVARSRAERIADLPHRRRLSLGETIETGLGAAGIKLYRRAAVHLDMVRGYADPAAGFLKSWKGYAPAWDKAMDPRFSAVGVGTHQAADDWIILVAVFLEDLPGVDDLRALEDSTRRAVNEIRREHGLVELADYPALADVARAHSEDMAGRDYFRHRSPEGRQAQHRVKAAGLEFRRLAENIQKSRGYDDPAEEAVEGWMNSRGHREAILEPDFRETGVGVAVAEDGTIYFTQLFLRRPVARGAAAAERSAP